MSLYGDLAQNAYHSRNLNETSQRLQVHKKMSAPTMTKLIETAYDINRMLSLLFLLLPTENVGDLFQTTKVCSSFICKRIYFSQIKNIHVRFC